MSVYNSLGASFFGLSNLSNCVLATSNVLFKNQSNLYTNASNAAINALILSNGVYTSYSNLSNASYCNFSNLSNASYCNLSNLSNTLFLSTASNASNIMCNFAYLSNNAVKSSSLMFPPLPMTSNYTVFTSAATAASGGISGLYQSTTSSTSSGNSNASSAFTLSNTGLNGGWGMTVGQYSPTTGSNIGNTVYTTVSGANVYGDWLQLSLPQASTISGYTVESCSAPGTNYTLAPTGWVIAGSVDGATWTTLDTRINQTILSSAASLSRYYATTSATTNAWQYLRYIVITIPAGIAGGFGLIGSLFYTTSNILTANSLVTASLAVGNYTMTGNSYLFYKTVTGTFHTMIPVTGTILSANATVAYTITHNLGTTNYYVTPSVQSTYAALIVTSYSLTSTTCQLQMYNGSTNNFQYNSGNFPTVINVQFTLYG